MSSPKYFLNLLINHHPSSENDGQSATISYLIIAQYFLLRSFFCLKASFYLLSKSCLRSGCLLCFHVMCLFCECHDPSYQSLMKKIWFEKNFRYCLCLHCWIIVHLSCSFYYYSLYFLVSS